MIDRIRQSAVCLLAHCLIFCVLFSLASAGLQIAWISQGTNCGSTCADNGFITMLTSAGHTVSRCDGSLCEGTISNVQLQASSYDVLIFSRDLSSSSYTPASQWNAVPRPIVMLDSTLAQVWGLLQSSATTTSNANLVIPSGASTYFPNLSPAPTPTTGDAVLNTQTSDMSNSANFAGNSAIVIGKPASSSNVWSVRSFHLAAPPALTHSFIPSFLLQDLLLAAGSASVQRLSNWNNISVHAILLCSWTARLDHWKSVQSINQSTLFRSLCCCLFVFSMESDSARAEFLPVVSAMGSEWLHSSALSKWRYVA